MRKYLGLLILIAPLVAAGAPARAPRNWRADRDVRMFASLCRRTFGATTTIPAEAISKMCECAAARIEPRITGMQRAILRRFTRDFKEGKTVDRNMLLSFHTKALLHDEIAKCQRLIWFPRGTLSLRQQKAYGRLANKSVRSEMKYMLSHCRDLKEPGDARNRCLARASSSWLNQDGWRYDQIPSDYITGNDMANEMIRNGRK